MKTMKSMTCLGGIVLAMLLLCSGNAAAQCASWCYTGLSDPTCSTLVAQDCVGTSGGLTTVYGVPFAPTLLTSCVCNTCESSGSGPGICTFSQTSGYQFCFTLGGSATYTLPIGLGLSLNASGQWCFDNETTTSASVEVICDQKQKRRGQIFDTITPLTISLQINYRVDSTFEVPFPLPAYCTNKTGWIFSTPCGSVTKVTAAIVHEYEMIFTDLECPEPIPCPTCPIEEPTL